METFCRNGYFADKTVFNTNTFIYELKAKQGVTDLDADFAGQTITLYMPSGNSRDWHKSDRVGFQNTVVLNSGLELSILVEKDFACLDERMEDQSDNYPNPLAKNS